MQQSDVAGYRRLSCVVDLVVELDCTRRRVGELDSHPAAERHRKIRIEPPRLGHRRERRRVRHRAAVRRTEEVETRNRDARFGGVVVEDLHPDGAHGFGGAGGNVIQTCRTTPGPSRSASTTRAPAREPLRRRALAAGTRGSARTTRSGRDSRTSPRANRGRCRRWRLPSRSFLNQCSCFTAHGRSRCRYARPRGDRR